MTAGGRSYYYLTDAIGSVIGLVDVDGNKVDTYAYSPRGVRLLAQSTEPVVQPYRFAGNYQDPTGLYHLKARYYDANIGRFTQPDPSGQEKNPYLYAEGDPVNRIDPEGLLDWAKYGMECFKGGCAIHACRSGHRPGGALSRLGDAKDARDLIKAGLKVLSSDAIPVQPHPRGDRRSAEGMEWEVRLRSFL